MGPLNGGKILPSPFSLLPRSLARNWPNGRRKSSFVVVWRILIRWEEGELYAQRETEKERDRDRSNYKGKLGGFGWVSCYVCDRFCAFRAAVVEDALGHTPDRDDRRCNLIVRL